MVVLVIMNAHALVIVHIIEHVPVLAVVATTHVLQEVVAVQVLETGITLAVVQKMDIPNVELYITRHYNK